MSVKRIWLAALIAIAGATAARAQSPYVMPSPLPMVPTAPLVAAEPLPMPVQPATALPHEAPAVAGPPAGEALPPGHWAAGSPDAPGAKPLTTQAWLDYEIPNCCGPIGADGPIAYDLYFRFGTNLPVAGSILNRNLDMGYLFFFGGRTLLFNQPGDAAWVIDLAIFYNYNNGNSQETIPFVTTTATIRGLHRSGASLGLGREWFASTPGFVNGTTSCNRSFGVDFGLRYGSAHVDLNVNDPIVAFARLQDNFGQTFIGTNVTWELPQGGWTFLIGGRIEWSYTWTNVLRAGTSDLHDLSFLLTTGVRF